LDGAPVLPDDARELHLGRDREQLRSTPARDLELEAGARTLEVQCVEPGRFAVDYLWVQLRRMRIPGAIEGEALRVVAASEGVTHERQALPGDRWSDAAQLWVRARAPGDEVELEVPVERAGPSRVRLVLTRSWDYGILQVAIDDRVVHEQLDTWAENPSPMEVDLGNQELGGACRLRLRLVGTSPRARAPGTYFGVDCVVLEPVVR
jgi:hypothetical protein